MRTQNSIKNVIFTSFGQFIRIIINFIIRIIFIRTLSIDYLGLDGLFANILCVLSLTELGIGQAITYSLYKPLKENNTEKLKSLMNIFKKAYTLIGILILVIGLSLNPVLEYFINEKPNISENLNLIYSLYVLTISLSYFFAYKRELINADQKMYISNMYIYGCLIVMNILQIIGLLLTKQYFVFLIIKIIMILVENFLISRKANELYPFLKEKDIKPLTKKDKDDIKKNTFGAIFFKAGKIFVNSTDNLIISKMIGLGSVGLYSNYRLITTSVSNILVQIFSSVTSSLGNLGTENKDKEKIYSVYKKIYFIGFCIYSLCSIGILFLINDFIEIWLGKEYLFDNKIVILIAINFFLNGISSIISIFRDAFGLYWKGKFKPLFELLVNLIFSIILGYKYGVFGVLLGTLISNIFISLWWEVKIIYNNIFNKNLLSYFGNLIKYCFIMLISIIIIFIITNIIIISNNVLLLIIKFILIIFIVGIIYFIAFYKTDEFIYLRKIISKCIKRKE